MADENLKSRHAFGKLSNLESAIESKAVDQYDVLFMTDDNDRPCIGWIDKDGNPVIVTDEKADLTEIEADVTALETNVAALGTNVTELGTDVDALETEVTKKADAETVNAKFVDIDTNVAELESDITACENVHEKIKYEIDDAPVGTLVDYRDKEIRIMCPSDTVWTKQAVGENGDANTYYVTFKTYAPCDEATGYIEHLNGESDSEILHDFSTDEYGRRYQPTWLGVAKYDESTDSWSYYGASSSLEKYIGWTYQIDWYNDDGVMIVSDCIRINLSNEGCHSSLIPSYITALVDEKVSEVASGYAIVEF